MTEVQTLKKVILESDFGLFLRCKDLEHWTLSQSMQDFCFKGIVDTYLVESSLTGKSGSTNVAAKALLLLLLMRRRRLRGVVVEEAVDLQALHVLECRTAVTALQSMPSLLVGQLREHQINCSFCLFAYRIRVCGGIVLTT